MSVEELKRPTRIDEERIQKLKELFPEAFVDGKLNLGILHEEVEGINEDLVERNTDESYGLHWVGKKEARRLAFLPSEATLKYRTGEGKYENKTNNLLIKGDNLEVLRTLSKSYKEKVKVIYIDPPYNRGDDLIYKDSYKDSVDKYLQKSGQADEEGLLTSNPKSVGRYHANWLNMMYPRLRLARNFLQKEGVIFVSIDDSELSNLRKIMDEIFGEENLLAELVWDLGTGTQAGHFTRSHEYILAYAKDKNNLPNFSGGEGFIEHGALKKIGVKNPSSEFTFPKGTRFDAVDGTELKGEWGTSEKTFLKSGRMIAKDGKLVEDIVLEAGWAMKNQMVQWFKGETTFDSKGQRVLEFYFNSSGVLWYKKERSVVNPPTIIKEKGSTKTGSQTLKNLLGDSDIFDFPKPINLIKFLLDLVVRDGDIVLDFFGGSGTTGQAVWEICRDKEISCSYILIQIPEKITKQSVIEKGYLNIFEVTKERLIKASEAIEDSLQEDELALDLGFRVMELTRSNFKKWDAYKGEDIDEFTDSIFSHSAFIEDWKPEDVLDELMLMTGFPLNSFVNKQDFKDNILYSVEDDSVPFRLHVCLDETLSNFSIGHLVSNCQNDVFICLDDSLSNEAKVILSETMKVKTI